MCTAEGTPPAPPARSLYTGMTRPCCAATPSRVCLSPELGPKGSRGRKGSTAFSMVHTAPVCWWTARRAACAPELASGSAAPPGSTLKPLVLNALLERGQLRAGDSFPCPHDLRLEGRSFDCSHPPLPAPLTVRTAIAYSCNCFVAHYAPRFRDGELARVLERWGLVSRTNWFGEREGAGRVWNASPELQALGEDGVLATPASLAMAYCRLASRAAPAVLAAVRH